MDVSDLALRFRDRRRHLPDALSAVLSLAAELKTALAREAVAAGLPDEVELSIGIAEVSGDATSLAEAVREADARMYRAKAGVSPKSLQVQ